MSESPYPWLAANRGGQRHAAAGRTGWSPTGCVDVGGHAGGRDRLHYARDQAARCPPTAPAGSGSARASWRCTTCWPRSATRKPAVTILLAHAGGSCDSVVCTGEIVRLAEELGRSGVEPHRRRAHRTGSITSRVAGIPIVETGQRGTDGRRGGPGEDAGGRARVPDRRRAGGLDARGWQRRARAPRSTRTRAGATRSMTRPIAQIKRPLVREGAQYPLGACIAEARRNVLRADLGLVRSETIRADLPAGPVTYERLSAVEPSRSDLVPVTLTGAQLHGAAGAGARRWPAARRCTWPARRCATIPRAPAGRRVRGGRAAGRPQAQARRRSTPSPPTLPTVEGAGGLTRAAAACRTSAPACSTWRRWPRSCAGCPSRSRSARGRGFVSTRS